MVRSAVAEPIAWKAALFGAKSVTSIAESRVLTNPPGSRRQQQRSSQLAQQCRRYSGDRYDLVDDIDDSASEVDILVMSCQRIFLNIQLGSHGVVIVQFIRSPE